MIRAPVPLISVGALEMGGSGKTPVAIEIARRLRGRGLRVALLSRGYRGGDEARMAAAELPDVMIRTGADRGRLALAAAADGAQAIVLDDGFSHRRLHRDLDVLVGDAWAPRPWLVRERERAAARAHLRWWHRRDGGDADPRPHVTSRFRADDDLAGTRVFLLSGIARPDAFERLAARRGATAVGSRRFRDHHRFTARQLDAIARAAAAAGADAVLTTAKDRARIDAWTHALPLRVLAGRVEIVAGERALDDALARTCGV